MNILIYTLLGVYCDFLQITQPTYMAEQIINVILLLLEFKITFSIYSHDYKLLYNHLIDTNTEKLENYITNIYKNNSLNNDHKLYILKEYYIDNENRSLEDYKSYLDNLSYQESQIIADNADLTIHDKYLLLKIINKYEILSLSFINNNVREHKEIVLASVNKNGILLQYASEELKRDKEVVLASVNQNFHSLKYASEELKKDKEFILDLVNKKPLALQYASKEFKEDKQIVLATVTNYGIVLFMVLEKFKDDRQIVSLIIL